jgi:predicted AAA+ superfamily ATPase
MKKLFKRSFVADLERSLVEHPQFIQVVVGPRQVGKTTGVQQLLKSLSRPSFYFSADGNVSKDSSWLLERYLETKSEAPNGLLIIDEIQKVENWAEIVKKIGDEEKAEKNGLQLILLGSSSLQLQHGLQESLAGRFILHKVFHWDFEESNTAYRLDLKNYLTFGGYPGSYEFIPKKLDWINYLRNSIIDPVIGKDILSIARVKSPALFKQCFDIACSYAGREISYTKLLGQLQDKGNTELVKYYLELFEQAYLIRQLFKFSNKKTLSKSSSPKILTLCPALYSITLDADYDQSDFGRAFEVTIGNLLHQLPGELFYWRERTYEVDFVLQFGKKIWAVEVKWGDSKKVTGLQKFKEHFPTARLVLITPDNFQSEIQRIKTEIDEWGLK